MKIAKDKKGRERKQDRSSAIERKRKEKKGSVISFNALNIGMNNLAKN